MTIITSKSQSQVFDFFGVGGVGGAVGDAGDAGAGVGVGAGPTGAGVGILPSGIISPFFIFYKFLGSEFFIISKASSVLATKWKICISSALIT